MKVFAPSAFRWPANSGQDYPYGLQDIGNDTLARALLSAGVVVADDPGDQVNAGDKPLSPLSATQVAAVQGLASGDGSLFGKLVGGADNIIAAAANTAALNAVLAIPGSYQLPSNLGDVFISATLVIASNVTLKGGRGTRIRAMTGNADYNVMRNANWGSTPFNITSLASADGKIVSASTDVAHGLAVNGYAFVAGALPDAYCGVWKVVSTPTPTTFTYVIAYFNGVQTSVLSTPATVNTGTSGVNIDVTATIGSPTLTVPYGPAYKVGLTVAHPRFSVGVTVLSYTATTITLNANALSSGTGALTTAIYSYSQIAGMKADYGITLDSVDFYHGWFAGDTPSISGAISYGSNSFSIYLRRIRDLKVINCNFYNCYVAVCYGNIHGCLIAGLGGDNNASMSQGYSGGSDITIIGNRGQAHDDGHSFLQGDWSAWFDSGAKYLTDVNRLTFRDNKSRGALTQVHCIGQAGVKYGKIVCDDCGAPSTGGPGAYIRFDEDQNVGSGATWDSIDVRSPGTSDAVARSTVGIGGSPFSATSATYRTFRVGGLSQAMATGSVGIAFGENMTLDCFQLSDSDFYGSAGTVCQAFIVNAKPVTIKTVQWNNVNIKGVPYGINAVLSAACTFAFNNVMMDGSASLIQNLANGGNRIYLNNVTTLNAIGSLINHGASSDASIYINNSPTVGNLVSGTSNNTGVFWSQEQGASVSGAAPAIDAKLGTTFLHTNSGANPTFSNPIWSGYPGYGNVTIKLILTEDATGNHTYAFGAKFLFTSAFVQPGAGSASKKTLLAFTFNGANWIQVGSTNVWY